MQINLSGKVALVTGGGRGIGRGIATTLAREGVTTIVNDIVPQNLASLTEEFAANGWRGHTAVCDVTDYTAIEALVNEIARDYGRLDILVNNAGVAPMGQVEMLSEEIWDSNLEVNLKGVYLMSKAVVPVMKRQQWGRIINASSFAAIIPSVGGSAYAASKAGVIAFTRTLASELGPWNITVNSYAPGMIPTQMNHFAEASPERQNMLLDSLSLRRWGEPQQIANLICFLASELAAYITGANIEITGGKFATQFPQIAYAQARQEG